MAETQMILKALENMKIRTVRRNQESKRKPKQYEGRYRNKNFLACGTSCGL